MTTVEVLRKARALVKKGWSQGTFARGKSGRYVDVKSPAACRFCAWGALIRVDQNCSAYSSEPVQCLARATGEGVPSFNDYEGRKKSDVLAAFDRAIKAAS